MTSDWTCRCGRDFDYGIQRVRHLKSGDCPVPEPEPPVYEPVAKLRCAVERKGRRAGGPCAQVLLELGRADDGTLAHHTELMRGTQVDYAAAMARGAPQWMEEVTAWPAADYERWLAEHDGEQPTERLDMGWSRHDDSWYVGPDAVTCWVPVLCTRHGGALIHLDYLRFVEQMSRRTVMIDVRTERHGVPSS